MSTNATKQGQCCTLVLQRSLVLTFLYEKMKNLLTGFIKILSKPEKNQLQHFSHRASLLPIFQAPTPLDREIFLWKGYIQNEDGSKANVNSTGNRRRRGQWELRTVETVLASFQLTSDSNQALTMPYHMRIHNQLPQTLNR